MWFWADKPAEVLPYGLAEQSASAVLDGFEPDVQAGYSSAAAPDGFEPDVQAGYSSAAAPDGFEPDVQAWWYVLFAFSLG